MEEMYHLCRQHLNRNVRVHTRCGVYEGVVVDVDRENVYLRTSGGLRLSAWNGPGPGYGYRGWGFDVLALSLFTLLAIALI